MKIQSATTELQPALGTGLDICVVTGGRGRSPIQPITTAGGLRDSPAFSCRGGALPSGYLLLCSSPSLPSVGFAGGSTRPGGEVETADIMKTCHHLH